MFAPETLGFLEGGCALIIGAVDGDGEPYATRGWGVRVLDDDTVRLVLAVEDDRAVACLTETGAIAFTAGDVRTLRSVQCKGRVVAIEPATADDVAVAAAYSDAFFRDVEETDRTPRAMLERLLPIGYRACVMAVDAVFDQSPGPGAGASIGTA